MLLKLYVSKEQNGTDCLINAKGGDVNNNIFHIILYLHLLPIKTIEVIS